MIAEQQAGVYDNIINVKDDKLPWSAEEASWVIQGPWSTPSAFIYDLETGEVYSSDDDILTEADIYKDWDLVEEADRVEHAAFIEHDVFRAEHVQTLENNNVIDAILLRR